MIPAAPRFGGFYEITLKTPDGRVVDPRPLVRGKPDSFDDELIGPLSDAVGGFGNYDFYAVPPHNVVVAVDDDQGDDHEELADALEEEDQTQARWELADNKSGNDIKEEIIREHMEDAHVTQMEVVYDAAQKDNPFRTMTFLYPEYDA